MLAAVRRRLAREAAEPSPSRVAAALRAEGGVLGSAEVLDTVRTLRADLTGAGPLEPLLEDPATTDILVNGAGPVWVDDGTGLRRKPEITFTDEAQVRDLAQRLAAQAGRRLDAASPWVDAQLDNGVRLHAVLHPVARDGTCLSLRLPHRRGLSLDELRSRGGLGRFGAQLLHGLVATRTTLLVSGGTGTGKTTLLNALLGLVSPTERLVLIEDSTELRPDHPHVVRLEARPPNVEGSGSVTVEHLVRQGLRMRPDRLVVGEARGAEVVSLLAALNTGHEGGVSTLHANAATDVPARIEALGCAAGLSREAVHSQLAAARAVVAHLSRTTTGRRRLTELCVLTRDDGDLVRAVPAVRFHDDGESRPGPGQTQLAHRLGRWWPQAPEPGEAEQ
ncbi:TadA family conjugal transfer-associated ATPase [Lipingzhangella sp. LS1_29]|uniref:TadA family conjugal transfer-associated ATPase n=1 Tax=Lipingzhangella rawalii TaxID=2055835 RepID=A0ABU2H3Z1_9ACTN|nr:TadA family conjugal transfer-associated ATPase [Lipingzhangella rawalii]MDS1270022.1 TadA family conjugal transfer-associated ATPase [Lipingzhangella rawalii]